MSAVCEKDGGGLQERRTPLGIVSICTGSRSSQSDYCQKNVIASRSSVQLGLDRLHDANIEVKYSISSPLTRELMLI
jgi:hypothetical protein